MRLILASASPRRAELLRAAGFAFEVCAVDIDERLRPGESAEAHVRRLAEEKSAAGWARLQAAARARPAPPAPGAAGAAATRPGPAPATAAGDTVVLGADTVVVLDGEVLGKPRDAGEARQMLSRLAGRAHEVATGVSLRTAAAEVGRVEWTRVWFAPLGNQDLDWYVQTGEGFDKAGGYAIQGLASRFIPRIEGSYSNVVGLPVTAVRELATVLSVPMF